MAHATDRMMKRGAIGVSSALLSLVLFGCAGSAASIPPGPAPAISPPTRANHVLDFQMQRDGRFIGIALSGGGSRAAVFGAVVLKELDRLGLLQQVDVISAVSGGALPAAYYALDGYRAVDFTNGVLERMGYDFQQDVLSRWLSPGTLLKRWFKNGTKSDTVVDVLDERLFHGATYADLNPARPKLLLNAADALTGDPFVISDETFAELASPLSSLSVARAVYMSAAHPSHLDPVPLTSPMSGSRPAVLVYDGGLVDNLGVKTLVNLLGKADEQIPLSTRVPNGCLLISVDATPRIASDDNKPLSASTVLLKSNRREVLERVGILASEQDRTMFGTFIVNGSTSSCAFWHLALRQLPDSDPLGGTVTRIKTSLGLDRSDQEALTEAARRLVELGVTMARQGTRDLTIVRQLLDEARIR